MATNSSAEACVASSTTGGATPASSASCQRAATTHHRSPATRPGNIHCGCGVTRSFPADDRELEELLGHHGADDVEPEVGAFSAAVAVAEIAGHGIDRARLQLAAEDVHDGSLGRRRPGLPQAASRDTPDTTITRHGAARSTWRTGSGETRCGDSASLERVEAITISSSRSAVACSTIAAPTSRARTTLVATLTPYASPVAPARSSSRRAASSASTRCASSGSSGGTSITATAVIVAPSSAASRQAISSASTDSVRASSGTSNRR